MRLSAHVHDRLLRLLPELYVCRTVEALLRDAVHLLKPLIPCDGCGWFIYALGATPGLAMSAESDPIFTPAMSSLLGRTVMSHPFLPLWATQAKPSTLMYSDVEPSLLSRHLSEFSELYREIGVGNLTVPVSLSSSESGALSYRRHRKPFSEHDRLFGNLLQPHLQQAFANAQVFSRFAERLPSLPETIDADLTERESQVTLWLAQGKTNREIALILNMRLRTVEKHVERVLGKLGAENRTSAALILTDAYRNT